MYRIANPDLRDSGFKDVEWAERRMPVLMRIRDEFSRDKPLAGVRIAAVLHVTKETAVLVRTLISGGADIWLAGSNPLSTQDAVAAALASEGVHVFAWRGQTSREYYECITQIAVSNPNIVIDDGADLHVYLHDVLRDVGSRVWGGTEETTTGVNRLRSIERGAGLLYPVMAVNDSLTKYMFDNRYGTGQSTIDGILRAANILLAGRVFVVAGYGWVGRGIAMRARGMGARVIVTEVDPVRALEAVMDGFEVMPMNKACVIGDIFVTATGNKEVLREEHFKAMKDGALLANAGHFNVEVSVEALERISISKRGLRPNLDEYTLPDGRRLYLIGEGRLVNLVAAEGHPSEVMDMSFANQALAAKYIVANKDTLERRVYTLPRDVDNLIARYKLLSMNIEIDELTEEQIRYLTAWRYGT
ncbi:MAG: adenosylhomocysteinase [Zestosphaera sp.]